MAVGPGNRSITSPPAVTSTARYPLGDRRAGRRGGRHRRASRRVRERRPPPSRHRVRVGSALVDSDLAPLEVTCRCSRTGVCTIRERDAVGAVVDCRPSGPSAARQGGSPDGGTIGSCRSHRLRRRDHEQAVPALSNRVDKPGDESIGADVGVGQRFDSDWPRVCRIYEADRVVVRRRERRRSAAVVMYRHIEPARSHSETP